MRRESASRSSRSAGSVSPWAASPSGARLHEIQLCGRPRQGQDRRRPRASDLSWARRDRPRRFERPGFERSEPRPRSSSRKAPSLDTLSRQREKDDGPDLLLVDGLEDSRALQGREALSRLDGAPGHRLSFEVAPFSALGLEFRVVPGSSAKLLALRRLPDSRALVSHSGMVETPRL